MTATVRRTRSRATVVLGFAAGAATALAVPVLALTATGGPLTAPKAIVLGAVEGITEYLPVSSTGHLLVVERLLGLGTGSGKAAADTYAVAIQLGAILAVVALYRRRIGQMGAGLVGRDRDGRRLLCVLAIAFVPAALAGVLLIGDLLSQARADGGLGWGTSATSYVFLAAILVVVVVMTRSQRVEPEGEALAP